MELKGTTKITGIFGDPLTYTLSPKMHNFAFNALKLDFVYLPFLVKPENLKSAVESIKSLSLAGVNVTIPHKETVIPYLDELDPAARKINAVNTILNRNGKLIGANTDAPGFLASLKKDGRLDPKNKRAVVLGAGGTARSICVALLESGIKKLTVINRTVQRAESLAGQLKKIDQKAEVNTRKLSSDSLNTELKECDLLVNATPIGMDAPNLPAAIEKFLTPDLFVFDAVYAKATPLILAAKKIGAAHLDGMGMLVHQGALSFALWTGLEPPVKLMKQALA